MSQHGRKLMGFETPGDQKVPVPARDWNAMKRAIWRSMDGWKRATLAAQEIVARCKHTPGCPGEKIETEPCLGTCPDREQRMSALVILNAARAHSPVNARQPADGQYFAPSREYFSEVLATLAAAQTELDMFHATYGPMPQPPIVEAPKPEQLEKLA